MSKVILHTRNNRGKKVREHNNFPQGKTGYIPLGSGVTDLRILKRK